MFFRQIAKALSLAIVGYAVMSAPSFAATQLTLKQQIGQKLMLDFRYYCGDSTASDRCRTPMTKLPQALADAISTHHIGGVILFAENIDNTEQIVALNRDLQQAALASSLAAPLFISVDQEGGRVARIPRHLGTAMTGNMSIGATYAKHGSEYASASAKVIAKELRAIGFNVNYAPTLDVNMNPNNPVINVRSFGEDPARVAELGGAQVDAYQRHQVIAALKHFPGHGDTNVDSHTGLPKVMHSKEQVMAQDIAPFRAVIEAGHAPGMIMTAHIQYPALDSSTFVSKQGQTMVKPATMSRAIMTSLLREELGYQGVTITDALDMAGISDFFTPEDALINTFKAGVDIALMPIAIRNEQDIAELNKLIDAVAHAIERGELERGEFAQSAQRVMALKADYQLLPAHFDNHLLQTELAAMTLGNASHRAIEAELASAAITDIKAGQRATTLIKQARKVALIMPDTRKCMALQQALDHLSEQHRVFHCISLQGHDPEQAYLDINDADVVIAANASPPQSAVEIGGMDDVSALAQFALNRQQQPDALESLLQHAQQSDTPVIFVSLRAPYDITQFGAYAQAVLATYAYNIDVDDGETVKGPAFTALAKVLLGLRQAPGELPVTIAPTKVLR